MIHGYVGKALEVDLATREIRIAELNEEWASMFIGGKGWGAKLLYDSVKPGLDPLAPENPLILIIGSLTATSAPTSGRWAVVTKSPLTGIFLDSQAGGQFGARLKMAGFDYLVVRARLRPRSTCMLRMANAEYWMPRTYGEKGSSKPKSSSGSGILGHRLGA